MPVREGAVKGQPCQILRDTGCGCVIVQRDLVTPSQMLSATQKLIMINGQVLVLPMARISVQSPYPTGVVDTVIMNTPVYPCIIGNVDGAAGAETFRWCGVMESTLEVMDSGQDILQVPGTYRV